jgi:putative endonuclease
VSWFVYIIRSETNDKLYTGITTDPVRRLREHNGSLRGAKSTRIGRPWRMVFTEPQEGRVPAMKRELAIKRLSRAQKLTLVERHRKVEELTTR